GFAGLGCLDGLCDFLPRSIPGSPSKRRRQGIVLLRVRRQRAARHLGSGIAISGATLCLSLTHLDYFRTLGPPCAVSMVVAVLSALTLGPALLTLGSKIGWIHPTRKRGNPVWHQCGTDIPPS